MINKKSSQFFGKILKLLRAGNELSMEAFCEAYNEKFGAKLNKSTVSRYENGTQEPMLTTVKNIASFFKVSPTYLLGYSESGDEDDLMKESIHISLLLKEWRIEAGYESAFDAAEKFNELYQTGLSEKDIQDYENGNKFPNPDIFVTLLRLYGIKGLVAGSYKYIGYDKSSKDDFPDEIKVVDALELTNQEKLLVLAYRNNLEMQESVNRLLRLDDLYKARVGKVSDNFTYAIPYISEAPYVGTSEEEVTEFLKSFENVVGDHQEKERQ